MSRTPDPILVTGATGYIGSHLTRELVARGHRVRALTRHPDSADFPAGVEAREGDALSATGLREALAGCHTAYYLIHSMGGDADDFAARDRESAVNFGEAVADTGVERVVYLGGLGPTGEDASEHLRSRHQTAQLLAQRVPEFVYVRAAMIIGEGSASFEILRHLVRRLPVMIGPRWLDTRTQPIAVEDVVGALADLGEREDAPAEVQLGGPDVLSYRDMMKRAAVLLGRRPPLVLRVPLLTPRLSSHWIGLVTPMDMGLVRPLVEGLKSEMVVEQPPPRGINDHPLGFEDAVKDALWRLPLNRGGDKQVANAVIADPEQRTSIDADGASRSIQAADIELPLHELESVWSPLYLERLARTYWHYLSRVTLGLVRMRYTQDERALVLVRAPLVLLRFHVPDYELEPEHGVVRWRIRDGLLVAKPDHGHLLIDVRREPPEKPGYGRVHVEVEVANFYPMLATLKIRWLYAVTQSRIHVFVTHGFLRSLAKLEFEESAVGRFEPREPDAPPPPAITVGDTPKGLVTVLALGLGGGAAWLWTRRVNGRRRPRLRR